MRKILFITPQNPELVDTGDKKYTWDILKAIKYQKDIFVHVVCFIEATEDKNSYKSLDELVDRVTYVPFKRKKQWRMALSIFPAFIAHRRSKVLIDSIKEILKKESYDDIIVNMFKMSYLISFLKEYNAKKIHISHNVEYLVSKSIYSHTQNIVYKIAYYLDYLKTLFWERYYLKQFDAVTAICDVDASILKKYVGKKNIEVIRPIVDIIPYTQLNPHNNNLIICGSFCWLAKKINLLNVLKSQSIKLLEEKGKKLLVIGRADDDVVKLGNNIPNVYVSGYVDSVEPYYSDSEISLIPEKTGGGFKLKIAEAVQHHLPMVAIKGAVTDNSIKANYHYIEASSFDELIIKGVELAENRELQEILVKRSEKLFSELYNIKNINSVIINKVL